jgi:hypothetical protein
MRNRACWIDVCAATGSSCGSLKWARNRPAVPDGVRASSGRNPVAVRRL